ncbi:UNVERIFIED_CONTAM: hypothetical protein PYX00_005838 [Menopon gallinae]
MFPLTKAELKEQAKIQRRRQANQERKERILNPRLRLFGVDVDAWQKQIEEKKRLKEQEKQREIDYHNQKIREDLICLAEAKRVKDEQKEILQKVQEFRRVHQRFEDRREYDLNDALYKKKALPARLSDDDPRCTISSAQKFEGEDLRREERLKVQGEQTRAWLKQQIEEKKQAEYEKQQAELIYMEAMIARDKRAIELARMEEECTRKLKASTAEFNKILADEKEAEQRRKQIQEDNDKNAEKANWLTSDFLTENPDVAMSNLGPNRMIGYMFKGLGPEAAFEVRKFQEQQIEEKKKRQEEEARIDKEWFALKTQLTRQIYFKDKELQEQQRALNAQIMEANRQLAMEKRERDEYLQKVVYTNVPTDEYYDQFNKSLY